MALMFGEEIKKAFPSIKVIILEIQTNTWHYTKEQILQIKIMQIYLLVFI